MFLTKHTIVNREYHLRFDKFSILDSLFELNDSFLWLREDAKTLMDEKRAFERENKTNLALAETKKEAYASSRSIKLGC